MGFCTCDDFYGKLRVFFLIIRGGEINKIVVEKTRKISLCGVIFYNR